MDTTTKFYVDITDISDSMLLESGTVIAEYHNPTENIHLSLEVVGDVSVTYKGNVYHNVNEFPQELRELIEKGFYEEGSPEHLPYYLHPDIEIHLNNWFELLELEEVKEGEFVAAGRAWEVDCGNFTPADIDSLFMETEIGIVNENWELEER